MNTVNLSFAIAIVYLLCVSRSHQEDTHDVHDWAKSRQKRFLIFPNVAITKLLLNFNMPVELNDRRAWRSLVGAWNFQWQHNLPTTVLHWWNSTYFPVSNRAFADESVPRPMQPTDLSAMFIYAMIENYMNISGMNGRACLQRAICQNAQVRYVGGVVDRIYQRLMTPEETMDEYLKDAYEMGSRDVDCYKTFNCPKGKSVFDEFVQIDTID